MNRTPVFEDELNDWLEDGPTDAPDRVLGTVLTAFPSIPQRRAASRFPWKIRATSGYARALAGIAAAVLVALGGTLLILRPLNQFGGPPSASASPTVSPSASAAGGSIDTSTWTPFTSSRHGLSIRYPADWTATKATAPWPAKTELADPPRPAGTVANPPDPMFDTFTSSGTGVSFVIASQPLPTGVTEVGWLTSFEASGAQQDPADAQCYPAPADMTRATVDGLPAWISSSCWWNEAIVFAGGRVYDIAQFPDPFYNYPLFEAFLATVSFEPTNADDTPVAHQRASPSPS